MRYVWGAKRKPIANSAVVEIRAPVATAIGAFVYVGVGLGLTRGPSDAATPRDGYHSGTSGHLRRLRPPGHTAALFLSGSLYKLRAEVAVRPVDFYRLVLLGLVIRAPTIFIPPLWASPAKNGVIEVRAALVDEEMQAHPVPLHEMVLLSTTGDSLTARTSTDGTASIDAPPGSYTLRSVVPMVF